MLLWCTALFWFSFIPNCLPISSIFPGWSMLRKKAEEMLRESQKQASTAISLIVPLVAATTTVQILDLVYGDFNHQDVDPHKWRGSLPWLLEVELRNNDR